MSFITPLLDTLLHEVLGKRMDAPVRRELNEAAQPVSRVDSPLSVRSDSRLNQSHAGKLAPFSATGRAGSAGGATDGLAAARYGEQPEAQSPTRFSTTARVIGDILERFPQPPSVIRAQTPLIGAGAAEAVTPEQLAGRLQSHVNESGLFYESHLTRWFRGELSSQQLQREPQMQLPRQAASAPASRPEPAPNTPEPVRGADENPSSLRNAAEWSRDTSRGQAVDESLQSLVRHQLELIASPVLRWEGDVWSGIFMALTIQLADYASDQQQHAEADGRQNARESREEGWESWITLRMEPFGEMHVRLGLYHEERLSLVLQSSSSEVIEQLEARRDRLLERLQSCGFAAAELHLFATPEGAGDE